MTIKSAFANLRAGPKWPAHLMMSVNPGTRGMAARGLVD